MMGAVYDPVRRHIIKSAGAASIVAAVARLRKAHGIVGFMEGAVPSSDTPLALPLLQSTDSIFTYLGYFNTPNGDTSFQYGGGALGIGGNSPGTLGSLYANGLPGPTACTLGKMSIPAPTGPGGTYTGSENAGLTVSGSTSISTLNPGGSYWASTTGVLEYGGNLYVQGAATYPGSDDSGLLVIGNTSVSGFSSTTYAGYGSTGGNYSGAGGSRMFAGSMNTVPAIWQPYLGKAYIATGPSGVAMSINSLWSNGYGFATFDPASIVSAGKVNLTEWTGYPFDNVDGRNTSVLSGYFQTTQSNWSTWGDDLVVQYDGIPMTAFIVPGTRTLLFIQHHCYGPEYTEAGSDPCASGSSGSWCTPISPDTQCYRRVQCVAYDLADILSPTSPTGNPNGTAATKPRPYAWWAFPDWSTYWGASGACNNIFSCGSRASTSIATFDYQNNILYVSPVWPTMPGQIYALKVAYG